MAVENPRVTRIHANSHAGISTSKVVTHVFEQILEAIHEGQLAPGEHISDTKLAEKYGVSRTPVREALQRLREIGVVEAAPNRFTRVAVVSPQETAEAMYVWRALFDALLDDVIPHTDEKVLADLTSAHQKFVESIANLDMDAAATANFVFFNRFSSLSTNAVLLRAITSVVHIVRLGSLHLPKNLDVNTLSAAQSMLIDAVRAKDVALAHEALAVVSGIEIPLGS